MSIKVNWKLLLPPFFLAILTSVVCLWLSSSNRLVLAMRVIVCQLSTTLTWLLVIPRFVNWWLITTCYTATRYESQLNLLQCMKILCHLYAFIVSAWYSCWLRIKHMLIALILILNACLKHMLIAPGTHMLIVCLKHMLIVLIWILCLIHMLIASDTHGDHCVWYR